MQVLGSRGRRLSAEIFFAVPLPKCEIWGDGGGLTVFDVGLYRTPFQIPYKQHLFEVHGLD